MKILTWVAGAIGALVLLTAVVGVAARFGDGPIVILPGGPLQSGELHAGREPDWTFAADIMEMELQLVEPPVSRTVWLMVHDKKLYAVSGYMSSTVGKLWKQWPAQALADGRAVVRIDGRRYERQLVRITDDRPLLDAIAAEVQRKYGAALTADMAATGDAWFFALAPRDERVASARDREVTQTVVERWKTELTNWGRWGDDDEIGTLNLISPDKRRQAAALVRDGVSVSLARDAETEEAVDNPRPYMVIPLGITADEIRVSYHGFIHTHLDFLNHNFIGAGVTYNGYQPDPAAVVEAGGHARNTIHGAKHGILTRGVLIDMARFKNVPYLEPGTPIYVEDLEAWEAETGVTVSAGDAVVIRTGRWARRAELGPWDIASSAAGLHASVIPWLKQRDIALLGGEAPQDVAPAGIDAAVTAADDLGPRPLHRFALIYLGMPLFDNLDLEALAEVASSVGRGNSS